MTHVVLVAHGSRDPRAAQTVREIARAVAAARPDVTVRDAYLDFDRPHLADVLAELADEHIMVVPLLLSAAYHARTDIPAIVEAARDRGSWVEVSAILADQALVGALHRPVSGAAVDAIVLAAAGTRDVAALAAIDEIAAQLGRAASVPCLAGYASGAGRTVTEAIEALRVSGARRIGLAAYFLAPGVLHDRALSAAVGTTVLAADPLGAAPEIIDVISARIDDLALISA